MSYVDEILHQRNSLLNFSKIYRNDILLTVNTHITTITINLYTNRHKRVKHISMWILHPPELHGAMWIHITNNHHTLIRHAALLLQLLRHTLPQHLGRNKAHLWLSLWPRPHSQPPLHTHM